MNFLGFYGGQPMVSFGGQMVNPMSQYGYGGFAQPVNLGPTIYACSCGYESFSQVEAWTKSSKHDRSCSLFRGREQKRPSSSNSGSSGRTLIMFHGTSDSRARSIESNGFQASVDGMLGPGVYLSKDISKASDYGNVVLRVSVNVGRVAKIDHQGHRLQKSWQDSGYDSAWVPPGCGMVPSDREENCIADPTRIKVLGRARG